MSRSPRVRESARNVLGRGLRVPLLVAIALTATGCASTYNYPPDGPCWTDAPTVVPADNERLTVVTFNIQHGRDAADALQELQADSKMRSADVYLLQEVDETAVTLLAEGLGCNSVYYPVIVHAKTGRNFGNAVLARGDIHDHRKVLFPHRSWKNGQRRGATLATVEVRGRLLDVASTHTETAWVQFAKRIEQASALCQDVGWSPRPMLIGGDFNVPFWGEGQALRERFEEYGFTLASGSALNTVKYRFGFEFTIDFVFSRGLQPVCSGRNETNASDHRPVWVEFEWDELDETNVMRGVALSEVPESGRG